MSESARLLTALEAQGLDPAAESEPPLAIRVAERPLLGMISLKADLSSPAVAAAVETAIGAPPPAVRRISFGGPAQGMLAAREAALWMAPDELLLLTSYEEAETRRAILTEALAGVFHLAVNMSDARAAFRLTGFGAREVLAKGAPVDLHPDAFGVGDVRRTRLGQVAAAFAQISDSPETFDLFCFRSVADHVWRWLQDSAASGALPDAFPR